MGWWKSDVPVTRINPRSNNDDDAETIMVALLMLLLMRELRYCGWQREAFILFLVVMLCALLGRRGLGTGLQAARQPSRRNRCQLREGASDSLTLGCCMPAIIVASLMVVRLRAGVPLGPLRAYLWAALACAMQPPFAMWCEGSPLPSGVRAHLDGFALGVVLTLVAVRSLTTGVAVGVVLAVHAATLHAALWGTVASFTIGEAATLAQGVALLATDAAIVSLCEVKRQGGRGGGGSGSAAGGSGSAAGLDVDLAVAPAPSPAHHVLGLLLTDEWCPPRPIVAVGAEALLLGGLSLAALLGTLLSLGPARRLAPSTRSAVFVGLIGAALGGVLLPWLSLLVRQDGLLWLLSQASQPNHLWLMTYWAAALLLGIHVAAWLTPAPLPVPATTDDATAQTAHRQHRKQLLLARKAYHFLAVAMFAPAVLYHRSFVQLAFCAALPLFAMLEVIRLLELPPLAAPLTAFLGRFLDTRDGGTLILTHTYLLLGCALPTLLPMPTATFSAAAVVAAGAPAAAGARAALAAAPHAGLLVLGIGDATAAAVGVHFGRTRWPRTSKSLEGTGAAVLAMLALLGVLLPLSGGDGVPCGWSQWLALAVCSLLACVLEAITTQIDNLFLPLFYHATLCLAAARELGSFAGVGGV